jgi:hypothetical protein
VLRSIALFSDPALAAAVGLLAKEPFFSSRLGKLRSSFQPDTKGKVVLETPLAAAASAGLPGVLRFARMTGLSSGWQRPELLN